MEGKKEPVILEKQNLWQFISTRNNVLSENQRVFAKNYQVKRQLKNTEKCQLDNDIDDYTSNVELTEPDNTLKKKSCLVRPSNVVRYDITKNVLWKLPPNRYDISKEPFANRQGKKGAYITKTRKRKSKRYSKLISEITTDHVSTKKRNQLVRNSMLVSSIESFKPLYKRISALISDTDLVAANRKKRASHFMKVHTNHCNQYKGSFYKAKRFGPPTGRLMTHTLNGWCRDTDGPGPAKYTISNIDKKIVISPVRELNQYRFYPKSIVPEREENMKKKLNNNPGPGRYDARFIKLCPGQCCQIYEPDLDLILENEDRFNFREIPYTPIIRNKYYSPQWNHVKGRGFTRLFLTKSKPTKIKEKPTTTTKEKPEKEDQIFKSYVMKEIYLRMVNYPNRVPLSICQPYKTTMNINFTRIVKANRRRSLRYFTNVAFGKTFAGFFATSKNVRPVKNKPIMMTRKSDIKSKYNEIPERLRPKKVHAFRRKSFSFLPMPGEKLLVDTIKEIREVVESGLLGFYYQPLSIETFLDINIPLSKRHTIAELNNMEIKHHSILAHQFIKQDEHRFFKGSTLATESYS